MTIKIRTMIKKDRPALVKILRNTPEFKPAEIVVAEEVIESFLDDPQGSGYHLLIAEYDSNVAGYICYGPTPMTEGTWDLYWMAVTPEKQGRGIGSSLMTFAEEQIKKAGGRLALIETSAMPAYDKARRLHACHGYEEIARVPDFYAIGDDKLILQKRLRG